MESVEVVLDDFIEGLFRLMLSHHQAQVVEMDLTLVQAQALRLLRDAPLSTGGLATALGISAPAVTQMTDRLGRKNLIQRRNVNTDRRAVIVTLTESRGRVVDGLRKRRNEVFAGTVSQLSDEDRMEVVGALRKIVVVLRGGEPLPRGGSGAQPTRRQKQPYDGRTAAEAPQASKEVGKVPVTLPTKRRMRIEWD